MSADDEDYIYDEESGEWLPASELAAKRAAGSGASTVIAWGPAIAAYYGSQFLNSTLPGGVLGDVDRAVRHGRTVEDVGRGARAVAGERAAALTLHPFMSLFTL